MGASEEASAAFGPIGPNGSAAATEVGASPITSTTPAVNHRPRERVRIFPTPTCWHLSRHHLTPSWLPPQVLVTAQAKEMVSL
ncbi:MAG: hypothetical protein ABI586_00370 [Candidatus Nanopelagicales bacterium]